MEYRQSFPMHATSSTEHCSALGLPLNKKNGNWIDVTINVVDRHAVLGAGRIAWCYLLL